MPDDAPQREWAAPIRNIEALKPYGRNPRVIPDAAIDKVGLSIAQFGWAQPIVVDKADVIIIGHARRLGALKYGIKEGPVYTATHLSPQQVKALRIADNRLHEEAGWDDALLFEEMLAIRDGEDPELLDTLGFSDDERMRIFAYQGEEDAPALADGDREPFQHMTFILHDSQVNVLQDALRESKDAGDFVETVNANSNGNALARIAEAYLAQRRRKRK